MSKEYPCIYWENRMCRKFSDDESLSFCVEGPCQYETSSNADRIRAMSDEELADWLNYYAHDGYINPSGGWLAWLKSPEEATP